MGGGHPDPEIRGRPGLQKNFFRPFGPQFRLNISGGGLDPTLQPVMVDLGANSE